MDGQIEVVNRILGNVLQCLTKEYGQAWYQIIYQVKFTYNDSVNRSTGKSPFEIVYGLYPINVLDLKDVGKMGQWSGHALDMSQSMQEVHEQVRKPLLDTTQRIKEIVDEKRKDIQFVVGDMVMVHLNKERFQKGVPSKPQMRRIGPCKILAKYGNNAYKLDLLSDMDLSPIFNVAYLVQYKGTIIEEDSIFIEVSQALSNQSLVPGPIPQAEKVLDSRGFKKIRHTVYMENLIKSNNLPESEATWLPEVDFSKLGVPLSLLPKGVT